MGVWSKGNMDKIGLFKGKPISKMSREDLLVFAEWAGKELDRLNQIARDPAVQDLRIRRELENPSKTKY